MSLLASVFFSGRSLITDLSSVGMKSDSLAPSAKKEYDVIIVGGGTAGCVLAARLSEASSVRVLLLESGGSGKNLIYTRIPAAFPLIFRDKRHVFQLYTEPQPFAGNRKMFWPRGKMLGGCSSINAEMAQYGAPGDFNEWAKISGDDSWAWANFKKYFLKMENYSLHDDNPTADVSQRGTSGPVQVGYFNGITASSQAFIKTCQNLGVPFSPDFNVVSGQTGVNRMITYIDEKRERVSSETAYLTPEVLARPNLDVVIHAQVTKVLFDTKEGGPRAVGVQYTKAQGSPFYKVFATKEIVISAGTIHSPQILMLSGVGPAAELERLDIPVVHDLAGVGSHLVDHPVVDCNFSDKTKKAPLFLRPGFNVIEILNFVVSLVQYLFSKSGPFGNNLTDAAAFLRSSDDPFAEKSSETLQDSTSDGASPDLEIVASATGYYDHGLLIKPHSIAMHAVLLRPLSVGRLSLKSSSPWDDPVLDPRYLENSADVKKLVRGLKFCLKAAQTEPLASIVDRDCQDPRLDHSLHLKTDEELEDIIRQRIETLYHPTSTCRMAPLSENGVVDSKLCVYGVKGLRVCDASIFPSIVSGHTAGAVFAIGEKLADMMSSTLSGV